MKKITFILFAFTLALAACGDKTKEINKGKLDPNAMVLLRPAKGVKLRSSDNPEHLTALEIVKQAWVLELSNDNYPGKRPTRGFADVQRDFEIPALKMWGIDIIDEDGNLKTEFIESYDVILVTENHADTIGYISNSVLREAESAIRAAYNDNNLTKVYSLFNDAYTFKPITGAEWRALKEQGQQ